MAALCNSQSFQHNESLLARTSLTHTPPLTCLVLRACSYCLASSLRQPWAKLPLRSNLGQSLPLTSSLHLLLLLLLIHKKNQNWCTRVKGKERLYYVAHNTCGSQGSIQRSFLTTKHSYTQNQEHTLAGWLGSIWTEFHQATTCMSLQTENSTP